MRSHFSLFGKRAWKYAVQRLVDAENSG
ncbi:hypothetical protein ANCCAN_22992 [Ancylostoma caninum]|uniref:Uncharacterized protein n=1 Tax=Ancylostoma caninum TaxID=29170 RepID=A0A368FG72_ANCCA|nr:hypothetical protein ANCCAN_22992 [Ancylostoma caninum]